MPLLAWIIVFCLLGGVLSVLAAALFLVLRESYRNHLLPHLVSFATGALLGAALLLTLLRLWLGPYAPDRIVAADMVAVIATAGIVVLALLLDSALYLDVALVYGVLAFVGVVALARVIEGEGR